MEVARGHVADHNFVDNEQRMKPAVLYALFGLAVLLLLYVTAACVVFDFSKPANAFDEEEHNGRAVAFGPRPRGLFCKPSYAGMNYDGSEWPFLVFKPVCSAWRTNKGYEAPSKLRKN